MMQNARGVYHEFVDLILNLRCSSDFEFLSGFSVYAACNRLIIDPSRFCQHLRFHPAPLSCGINQYDCRHVFGGFS
jgi:hypothetical protein